MPALSFSAAEHYEAWELAISEFAGRRLGQPADSLYPLTVGRAALAACRAAYDRWSARADDDLTTYLDAALTALATGFAPDLITQASATASWQQQLPATSPSTATSGTASTPPASASWS